MSTLKVDAIRHNSATSDAITTAADGTCTAKITNNLSNRNMVINGASQISQRYGTTSTSISGTGVQFPVDRFVVQTNLGSGHSHQQVADAPTGFYYSQKVTCGTGGAATGSNFGRYRTTLEWQDVIPQSGFGTSGAKQLVLSFYVKSSLTGTFGVAVQNYTNNRNIVNSYTINSANTWERKTIVIAADTNSNWVATTAVHMEIGWDLGEGPDRGQGTLNSWAGGQSGYGYDSGTKFFTQSNATWQITGVQLEVGSVATPFEHRSYADELRRCQRYYHRQSSEHQYMRYDCNGQCPSANGAQFVFSLPVKMRAVPTIGYSQLSDFYIYASNLQAKTPTNITLSAGSTKSPMLSFDKSSTFSAGAGAHLTVPNSNQGYIEFKAEL